MSADDSREALIVATYGRRMSVRLDDDTELPARVKGRRLQPVCGDRVRVEPIENEPEWLIVEVLARDNELSRPDSRGRSEVLAANISLVVVVVADPPAPDWFIVDRYLAAAEHLGIGAAIVYNKVDLPEGADRHAARLDEFTGVGYPVLRTSARRPETLAPLEKLLAGEIAIFVGQSGVGKSTLINALSADASLRTGELSTAGGQGRHTTVNSVMLSLPGGGAVIDSPGVRDYAPALESADRVAAGFPEIARLAGRCRFADCRHLREPNCAVKAAVEAGEISGRRYESYKRLLNLTRKLTERRY